jgi:amidophosphoribosyltransferase
MYTRSVKAQFDTFHEECGVFGVYSDEKRHISHTVYYGLYALQHRGQESAGIAVAHDDKISYYRDMGLVPEVFGGDRLAALPEGDIAIGHVRYSTSGLSLACNCQPLVFTGKSGRMALAHNGNIVNARALRDSLIKENFIFQTNVDTEVVSSLINKYTEGGDIVSAIRKAAADLKGAYSLVIMTANRLIAVRDPYGIRPLCLGRVAGDTIVASETCALDAVGAEFLRDVRPGEIVIIDCDGIRSEFLDNRGGGLCIFEYVYFARPDSVIEGCSVYDSRKAAGRILAEKYPAEADIVSGVPDSAVVAARGYSEASGIPYAEALNKNRYVGRTFIQPEQAAREVGVRIKMNALKANINGKRIVLIDDSIVRGTTSRKIVDLLKHMGAKEVHMRICSPMVKHPCYFGIDIQTYAQLLGASRSKKEMCEYIGADSLEFLTPEELRETVLCKGAGMCDGCFTGKYPFEFDAKDAERNRIE